MLINLQETSAKPDCYCFILVRTKAAFHRTRRNDFSDVTIFLPAAKTFNIETRKKKDVPKSLFGLCFPHVLQGIIPTILLLTDPKFPTDEYDIISGEAAFDAGMESS